MARDEAYRKAEQKIEQARRTGATELDLNEMDLTELPESLGNLTQLQSLNLSSNQLTALPETLGNLTLLQTLDLSDNHLTTLPEAIGQLTQLQWLNLSSNHLTVSPRFLGLLVQLLYLNIAYNQLIEIPINELSNLYSITHLLLHANKISVVSTDIGKLKSLKKLTLEKNYIRYLPETLGILSKLEELRLGDTIDGGNELTDLPPSLAQLEHLSTLELDNNPLKPELAAAYAQGLDAVKAYLRAKAGAQVVLNQAKLILVGEGEVGKSCLMDALQGAPWQTHETTHGIEIRPVVVNDPAGSREITLNGWDFGGQRVYRPTHQLFFSSPAVYLVVWKPREGPQQGFVKEWIKLVKHREPDAKVLVVATHGGPGGRQPDIDRQELWDLFGDGTVLGFFHVDSKPNANGERRGVEALRRAIARVAVGLPEVGRTVPKRWEEVRAALEASGVAYLPLDRVLDMCRERGMDDAEADLFVTISHRLGHLIHYQHDPALRDIVVLKPDWLATAISFVLDDEQTRRDNGMVSFGRLRQLWDDSVRAAEFRYPAELHPIFLRLMERFDLSYRVAGMPVRSADDETSLVAQLVPDNRPTDIPAWAGSVTPGNTEQVQICRIVDERNGQSASAEGLFYQLIVRLHKFSLGRADYRESVHWQRGLVLDDDYNGRALLEHTGNDVRITVRAPYPAMFLAVLTNEVKWLVDNFWQGLRCDVMVPCLNPQPCMGLFEVRKLIANKARNRPEQPCPVCNEWQNIDALLLNAPAALPAPATEVITNRQVLAEVRGVRRQLATHYVRTMGRFDGLDTGQRELLSKADAAYAGLMGALIDEAKEGPRLFSLVPVDRTNFNPKEWASANFRLSVYP
jgi:Leucine-rich repeat (LRR) protein